MKKITALILTVFICMSAFGSVGFAEDNTVMDNSMMEKMEFLKILDIIPDYNELNADLLSKISRADFASVAAGMIGETDYSGETYYYDVPKNYWAFKEISALTKRGILSGNSEKLFSPDETISVIDGYVIIIRMLGLEPVAVHRGGYPSGYITVASTSGLTKDIGTNTEMTLGTMFTLLYNTLTANVMEATSFKGDDTEYKISEEETYLSVYKNIYCDEGVLESADGAGYSSFLPSEGRVVIDGVEYKSDMVSKDWLGEETEFFYKKNDNGNSADSKEIIWAHKTGATDVLNIAADYDAEFDRAAYELKYTDGDKYKTIKLDRGIKVVYNGAVTNSDLSSVFNKPRYTAKFIKGSGAYDTAVVWTAEDYLVKSFDSAANKVYDKLTEGRILSLNEGDYDRFALRFDGGSVATSANVVKDTVLSVYKSADNTYCEVVICSGIAEGAISSVYQKNGRTYYRINDGDYPAAALIKYATGRAPNVGESVRFKLDAMGDIVYVEGVEAAYLPGYIIKVAKSSDSFDDALHIKYLDNSGAVKETSCDTKLKIDGVDIKDMSVAYTLLHSDKGQFVLIKADSDGKIKGIDTVAVKGGGNDDVLRVNIAETTINEYRNSMGTYFWDKGVAGPDTVIFYVPTDANIANATDTDFYIRTRGQITDGTDNLTIESYKTKEKVGFEQYVVVKAANPSTVDTKLPILVESIGEVLNADGETVEELNGRKGKEKIKLTATSDFSFKNKGVGEGDVICCYLTSIGEVSDVLVRYDYDESNPKISAGNATASNVNANPRYYTGYVNDVVDGVIKIGYNSKDDCDVILDPSYVATLVYDHSQKDGQKVSVGSTDDAITPEMDYNNSSLVFVNTVWISPRVIIIYK